MRALGRIWLGRRPWLPRPVRMALALACAAGALSAASAGGQAPLATGAGAQQRLEEGRALYVGGCSSCHGLDATGVKGVGPSLHGVGAGAAHFYISTGRMPLSDYRDQPQRTDSPYTKAEQDALIAYVASLGGPPAPSADPAAGNLSEGTQLFTEHCAGCHQVVAAGGLVTGAQVPSLKDATPGQLAEAVRAGPYLMPKFSPRQIDQQQLDSIARYVEYAKHPDDRGGWAIGHVGPIPEGMVAWLLAGAALVLVARIIGERLES